MGWNILRKKRYNTRNPNKDEILDIEEWQNYVNQDNELVWAECSPIADIYKAEGEIWIDEDGFKHNAYYEINKSGYGNLRFKFFNHYLSIDCERQTLKRVEKMWEVAKALNGYLFKNGTRFTEKKLEKLRKNHDKTEKKL